MQFRFIFILLFMSVACKKKDNSVVNNTTNSTAVNCIDTISISYSKHIQPILNKNCVRCHDAETGQNLTSYQTTLPFAKAGIIEGCITGQPDFILMPPANKMDSCSIRAIQAWIHQGMKNN